MTDEKLLDLMQDVDPDTKRVPPGIRQIAAAIEASERQAIVAYLRGHPDGEPLGLFCDDLADWIEQGKHHV